MSNEETKVISFPFAEGTEENMELTEQEQAILKEAETIDEKQMEFISTVVGKVAMILDEESSKLDGFTPYHIPIEVGIGVSATYLNMFNDESGTPVESLIDQIQTLSNSFSIATEQYFNQNPEVPASVYFFALLHCMSSSLRQQRFMMTVEHVENKYTEDKGE